MNKRTYTSKITSTLIKKIVIYNSIYSFLFFLFYLFFRWICSLFLWQPWQTSYLLLSIFKNKIVIIIIWLIGLLLIAFFVIKKTLSYIDEIIYASSQLIEDNDLPITLSKELAEIEDKLNLIKQTSRTNQRLVVQEEKRKNDLIIYLAHDIKTPLTSMIGYLSLLDEIDDMPSKQRKKYINIALEKSYRLENLINELFDITRFNEHTIAIEKEELNLTMMLEQIIDDFYPILKEMDKKIIFSYHEKLIILGDSDKLGRVFNNLIKNAIYYSSDKTDIEVEIEKTTEDIFINIINYGKVIPQSQLTKIFEKFYRLDTSRTSKTGGSGLGLAIAREIVELHNGTITATSRDGQTIFQVTLPISKI